MRTFAAAGAMALVVSAAGTASAQRDEGPVRFHAEGNDQCEVTFTIENDTNSEYYTIDFMIDDEFAFWEEDGHYSVTRFALDSQAEAPTFPGSAYVSDRNTVTSERTIELRDLEFLPNPDADRHEVSYRMIRGPVTGHRDDANVYTTEVTGCEAEGDGGVIGSLIGSVDVFGSLGSMS